MKTIGLLNGLFLSRRLFRLSILDTQSVSFSSFASTFSVLRMGIKRDGFLNKKKNNRHDFSLNCLPNTMNSLGDICIENMEFPTCRSCKYYLPGNLHFDGDFSRCNKFGKKDIITGEIDYRYTDICRMDETKCGQKGRYYILEPNLEWKIWKYTLFKKEGLFYIMFIVVGVYYVFCFWK